MRTTELFVEQLVIGVATLVTGLLLFDPGMIDGLREVEFGTVVLATTSAYLLGIVTDRVADTLLERAERIHRLLFGLRGWDRWAEDRARRRLDAPPRDPFPEDELRARLWGAAPALTEYATYHRSRMRLMRAMTVLAPAAGAALIALRIVTPLGATGAAVPDAATSAAAFVRAGVTVAYGLAFVVALWPRQGIGASGVRARLVGPELPRTDALASANGRRDFVRLLGGSREDAPEGAGTTGGERRRPLLLTLLLHDPSTRFAALLVVVAAWRGATAVPADLLRPVLLIALGTALVTLLFGWTWWRVTRTFFDLLEDLPATSAAPPRKD